MTQRRLQLVVNPAAAGGRAGRALPRVEQALGGHDLRVTPTRSIEHADELAAQAVADQRVVVAMGGDGLVGRVAGAVADAGGVLAVLPAGRGNDFARKVGLPADAVEAAALLDEPLVEQRLDVGTVDGRPFLGIASVGFDSDVQERTLSSRLPLGELVYLWGALATLASWTPAGFEVEADDVRRTVHGWSVAAANSGIYGGGMRLAPDARLDDGLLDVVLTSDMPRRTFLASLPKVFRGTHVHDPAVEVLRARSVRLSADRPFRVFADGDPIGHLPCEVAVRAGALRVLQPRPSRERVSR